MKIDDDFHKLLKQTFSALQQDRYPFWQLWRELADFFLPKRYIWLQSDKERRARNAKNPNILDGTGTKCARILAAGMYNGVTSPSRPWFSLRIPGFADDPNSEARLWCDEVTRRMMQVMAETNYYNSMAVLYLDLVVFGSAANLIYEDDENVFRCYNSALGEFYFAQNYKLAVDTFGREITLKVNQVVSQFGLENCSQTVQDTFKRGGDALQADVEIYHLIEPNNDGKGTVNKKFPYRETYWEKGGPAGTVLRQRGFHELPGIFPRWELTGNDAYGTSPAMDALPDVIQLQHETKRKAQGLDKMLSPPMVADIQLQHRPTALMPNGITYVAGGNNVGMKPAYQVQFPLDAVTLDINDVRQRIAETFHNELFNMISNLDSVRSATEIDARREEKLVMLGSVLERFENEALDPSINRIFNIMLRAGLLPEPPESIAGAGLEIQYVSILTTAQRATSAIPTERWIGLIGNLAQVAPSVLNIPNWDEMIRNYGEAIGVQARDMNSREVSAQLAAQQQGSAQEQEALATGGQLAQGAELLSKTDVGGGANALQMLLGG